MKIKSREYKLLIDHGPFRHRKEAVEEIWREIRHAAKHLPAVRIKGALKEAATKSVRFLDTPDYSLRRNGLILRQRWNPAKAELTLKCRSDDLFLAAGTDVRPAKGIDADPKFEEDIAPPFLCRFSHSSTVPCVRTSKSGKAPETPETIEDVAAIFPVIGTLSADERKLHRKVEIRTVQGIVVQETVWESDLIEIRDEEDARPLKASFAAILWTRGQTDLPVIAELSFKLLTDDGVLSRSAASGARSLYRALQALDCYRSDARTKTEYIYRDGGKD